MWLSHQTVTIHKPQAVVTDLVASAYKGNSFQAVG